MAATFSTSRSPVSYWPREGTAPLFAVPEPFRPPYSISILRTAEGTPVRIDGTPDPDRPESRRFLLRVEPDGTLSDLRGSLEKRNEFMKEIFNHGLRFTRFMASTLNPGN